MLVYGEDLSHGDAAKVMDCSEKTVSRHLHEARKRLKVMLEPEASPSGRGPEDKGQPKPHQKRAMNP